MQYRIDPNSSQPAYMQLYIQLREDIVRGVWAYGAKLPSKRLTAAEVGVSVITVEHTYEILSDEGYIESRERSGYFVCYKDTEVFPVSTPPQNPHPQKAGGHPDSPVSAASVLPKSSASAVPDSSYKTPEKKDSSFFRESSALLDETTRNGEDQSTIFPYGVLARTMRRVLTNYGEKILVQTPGRGLPELRIAIASYLARSRGVRVQPSQIVIGAGAEYMYSLIVQILGHDRIFALENPSYEKIRRMYEANGIKCEMLKMGRDGILTSELAGSHASVLHVTPYNSFPSGITASASRRREYINWALNRNGFIIEDDFDSEYTVSTKAADTLFSLEPTHTVFYLNTFSKTIAPSVRVGYMILPAEMDKVFQEKVGFYASTVPAFEQYVIAELINNGDFERHINRVRRARRKKT